MEVAQDFVEQGYIIYKVLSHCQLAKSTYYYTPTGGCQGRKPYAKIYDQDGKEVGESQIVEEIKMLFAKPYVDYGSYKTFRYLKDEKGYKISKHLVYKLMKINKLTRSRYRQSSKGVKKNWVKDLIPQVEMPFNFFEFDIKFMWVTEKKRNIQVLTIVDVFTRMNLGHYIGYSIKYQHVIDLFVDVIEVHCTMRQWKSIYSSRTANLLK